MTQKSHEISLELEFQSLQTTLLSRSKRQMVIMEGLTFWVLSTCPCSKTVVHADAFTCSL